MNQSASVLRHCLPALQTVTAFLVMMTGTLPFVMVTFVEQQWLGITLSFIIVLTYFALNEVRGNGGCCDAGTVCAAGTHAKQ